MMLACIEQEIDEYRLGEFVPQVHYMINQEIKSRGDSEINGLFKKVPGIVNKLFTIISS